MIHVLVTGELAGEPVERTSAAGKPYATAQMRVSAGETAMFTGVVAFEREATEKLLRLHKGDAIAVAGTMRQTAWTAKDGTERTGWSITAGQVLTIYEASKRRKRAQADEPAEDFAEDF